MEYAAKELINFGFSDKEAAVYLAALQLGLSSIQDISEKSNVNRATTYLIINGLIKRGLISSFIKDGRNRFAAESPDKLLSLLRLQKRELEEKERELSAVMPKLLAIHNIEGDKPQIRYLEGFEGVASVMKVFEETEGEFIQVVNIDEVDQLRSFFQYRAKHLDSLREHKVSYRVLAVMNEPDFSKVPSLPGGEVRLIPTDKFPLKGDISVRGNNVFMYSFQEKMIGIVITSVDLANTIRQLFNVAWEGSNGYMSEKR
ncbi:MAG: helix-turn-helix domain-containing protein [Patescibacteria group bacterium]|jgi:sugar-specific transcriptional regulator TrmB